MLVDSGNEILPRGTHVTTRRLIARLDIKGPNVVRGIQLEGLRVVGKPEEMAARYFEQGIDELVFIDTVATLYGRNNTLGVVERTAERAFIPLTVGGGIRSLKDVDDVLRAGADKVTVNSAAVRRPEIIGEIAREFGVQCVVSAIEVKRSPAGGWKVMIENGRETTGLDAVEWAKRVAELGAGEILLTSIDSDGMRRGFDLELTSAVSQAVKIPVIASGGAASAAHVAAAFEQGNADAVALGTLLHFNLVTLPSLKEQLLKSGVDVRPIGRAR